MDNLSDKRRILPPLDYFLAFETAAKLSSFAAASRELNISETAISRKVKLLEQHYGTALFVRSHRAIALTPQGKSLLGPVCQSLEKLRVTSREMLSRHQLNTVNLAATNSVSSLWLMPRLRKFNRSNKQIKIKLVSSDDDDDCLADIMDLSILRGEGDWPGYHCRQLFGETIFAVCTPGYLQENPWAACLEKLPELDLIELESSHSEWMNWRSWLSQNDINLSSLKRITSFNTFPLSIQAAVDGLGIALGWQHLVDPLLESGKLIRPLGNTCVRTLSGYYLLRAEEKKSFSELEVVENWLIRESESRIRFAKNS